MSAHWKKRQETATPCKVSGKIAVIFIERHRPSVKILASNLRPISCRNKLHNQTGSSLIFDLRHPSESLDRNVHFLNVKRRCSCFSLVRQMQHSTAAHAQRLQNSGIRTILFGERSSPAISPRCPHRWPKWSFACTLEEQHFICMRQ